MTHAGDTPVRRVLVVEDDASIARFIGMALEDQQVDLVVCADAESALTSLDERPVRLIITDLMLPGVSGYELVERLQHHPERLGAAKIVVFSAGMNAGVENGLKGMGVWRILYKPASVAQLQSCVQDALAEERNKPATAGPTCREAPAAEDGDFLNTYFGGNAALFREYKAMCAAQFSQDLKDGDIALHAGDLGALRRLAHSLRTVLRTLGAAEGASMAQWLETVAATGDATASATAWAPLRRLLFSMADH